MIVKGVKKSLLLLYLKNILNIMVSVLIVFFIVFDCTNNTALYDFFVFVAAWKMPIKVNPDALAVSSLFNASRSKLLSSIPYVIKSLNLSSFLTALACSSQFLTVYFTKLSVTGLFVICHLFLL